MCSLLQDHIVHVFSTKADIVMVCFLTDKYVRAECPCLSARYTVALLACFGFSIMFGMRCNMSMAKLKMTEKQSVSKLN